MCNFNRCKILYADILSESNAMIPEVGSSNAKHNNILLGI